MLCVVLNRSVRETNRSFYRVSKTVCSQRGGKCRKLTEKCWGKKTDVYPSFAGGRIMPGCVVTTLSNLCGFVYVPLQHRS